MNALPLILTVFVACAVEAVEALTIVLAVGITREWRSTFQGMAAALVALAVITASTTRATAMPWNVDRHSRVMPAASTIVRASIASTAQATKTVRISGSAFNEPPQLSGRIRE